MEEQTIVEANGFQYPDAACERFCRERLERIRALKWATVQNFAAIGGLLEEVKERLPHGQYGPWLEAHWGGSKDTARRCCLLNWALPKIPQIAEFQSVTAASEFVTLEPWQQEAVLERGAFTWTGYRQAVWDATMRHHLADDGVPFERRYGDVYHAIEDARGDPALGEVAAALYREHRDTFARLSDREPAEVDAEVGVPAAPPPPRGEPPPHARLVEQERYWVCERVGERWQPVAPVASYVLAWLGGGEPSLLACFPQTTDGPAARAWQGSAVDAVVRRLGATTVASMYGEVL